jgi:cytochrome c
MWRRALLFGCGMCLGTSVAAQEVTELRGHGGPVMDLEVSADGTTALSASFDNSVGFWSLEAGKGAAGKGETGKGETGKGETGKVVWLEGHEAAVKSVTFLGPDRAASGGDDFAIQIWDLSRGVALHRLSGHQGQVKDLAVSPDGKVLASAGWGGAIGLWDARTGAHLGWLNGHSAPVNAVDWIDETTLVSGSADGTLRTWDTADTARQIQTRVLIRHGFGVTTLLVNRAGGWLVYGALDGGTRVIDLASDAVLADLTLDRRPVLDITARKDFSQIAVGDGEGHIMVVDTANWRILHDFRAAKRGPIWALAYDASGAALFAGGIDDTAHVWPIGQKSDGPIMSTAERSFLKDPEAMTNGERQFARKCSVCHSLTEDGLRRAGPTLAGLFGRKAGTSEGYLYSDTVATADIIWSDKTIDLLFDLGPDHYIPGSKMPMQRITDPADRADLIAYLRENTKG